MRASELRVGIRVVSIAMFVVVALDTSALAQNRCDAGDLRSFPARSVVDACHDRRGVRSRRDRACSEGVEARVCPSKSVEVPPHTLSRGALRGLIEEFVTRSSQHQRRALLGPHLVAGQSIRRR